LKFFLILGLPDSEPENSHVVRSMNAQRLLVCSWRSMRDICLLLSEVIGVVAVEGESSENVMTFDQVKTIGDHLLFLLKNVMHRGVFEQVFTGFKQLAHRLFKSTSNELNALPEKWLNDALDEELISTKCITRRSAGLPFIFQALLSPVAANEGFIEKYIERLFQQYLTFDSSYVRIHCTNVLRGLFKDANFSRVIMPYVPRGLQLAFNQLKSSNWNVCLNTFLFNFYYNELNFFAGMQRGIDVVWCNYPKDFWTETEFDDSSNVLSQIPGHV